MPLITIDEVRRFARKKPVHNFLQQFGLTRQPGLNLFDQARLNAGRKDQWDAMSQASTADQETYKNLLRGLATMAGARMGPEFEGGIENASQHIAKLAPYMMTANPELWDQLHGGRGSAASLARAFQQTHPDRTPLENASAAQQVYKKLYANGSGSIGGYSAGDVGLLYHHMNDLGLLSNKGGPTPDSIARDVGTMGRALRTSMDTVSAQRLPELLRKNAGILTNLLGHKRVVKPRSILKRLGDEPKVGVPEVESTGQFHQFKPEEALNLFQTTENVPHPGYDIQPPQRPQMLLDLINPMTAAKARATFDRGTMAS